MANQPFTRFLQDLAAGTALWDSDDVRVLLLDSSGSYTFTASHQFVADVLGAGGVEPTDGNYARMALSGRTVTVSGTSVLLNANNAVLSPGPASGTVVAAVIFEQVTNDADSRLIAFCDEGFPDTFAGNPWTFGFTLGRALSLVPAA